MTTHRVLILGAGAAGTAAARTLAGHDDLDVALVSGGEEEPYTRMLIKGVAVGSTPAEVIRLPLPNVRFVSDTADSVDATTHRVRLASGRTLDYDSLIIATGSAPRHLPATVTGTAEAHSVTPLHSLRDALRIRQTLATGQKHVLLYGGGVTAAETASLLIDAGHSVTLIARNALPGVSVFGRDLAQSVAQLHRDRMDTRFGCAITSVSHNKGTVTVHLDDSTSHTGDLLVVALGTVPLPPAPWGDCGSGHARGPARAAFPRPRRRPGTLSPAQPVHGDASRPHPLRRRTHRYRLQSPARRRRTRPGARAH